MGGARCFSFVMFWFSRLILIYCFCWRVLFFFRTVVTVIIICFVLGVYSPTLGGLGCFSLHFVFFITFFYIETDQPDFTGQVPPRL